MCPAPRPLPCPRIGAHQPEAYAFLRRRLTDPLTAGSTSSAIIVMLSLRMFPDSIPQAVANVDAMARELMPTVLTTLMATEDEELRKLLLSLVNEMALSAGAEVAPLLGKLVANMDVEVRRMAGTVPPSIRESEYTRCRGSRERAGNRAGPRGGGRLGEIARKDEPAAKPAAESALLALANEPSASLDLRPLFSAFRARPRRSLFRCSSRSPDQSHGR